MDFLGTVLDFQQRNGPGFITVVRPQICLKLKSCIYLYDMNKEFTDRLALIEKALNNAINMNFDMAWQELSFRNLPAAVKPIFIQNLIEPNKHLIDLGGKRWRPLLLILCYEMAKKETPEKALSQELAYSLTPLVEFVHTASLIHDDIEDSADLRRGEPAAHITYGLDTALNAGAWLYFEAPVCINNTEISDELKLLLYKVYTLELRRLHLGQAMDIYWHRTPTLFPARAEYESMVKCKTGTLAALASQIGCVAGGMSLDQAREIGETAANIGIGFQIIDDVINLTTGNAGKKRGDDIVEGKKSLPVLIHTEEYPEDKDKIAAFMAQAAKNGIDDPAVEDCIALLQKSNCIEKAAAEGTKLIRENCGKLKSELINELFISMVPAEFR